MTFNELIENVKDWSTAKGIDKASPLAQMLKLNEEWGELNAGKAKADKPKLEDSIGDVLVVLIILSQQMQFENIEQLVDPMQSGYGKYTPKDVSTDMLLLYGAKEIGLIASSLIDLVHNPGIINTRTQIQFHIRNLSGVLYKVAINEDTDMVTCLGIAWNEIKDRQGKMVDGVFVKDSDLEEGEDA